MIEANKVYSMEIVSAGLAENKAGDKSCIELELAAGAFEKPPRIRTIGGGALMQPPEP